MKPIHQAILVRLVPASIALAALLLAVPGCDRTGSQGGAGASGDRALTREAPPERPELNDELFAAVMSDDEARAIELVEQGASVNARNPSGTPILFLAAAGCIDCEGTMPELTRLLLEYGADPGTRHAGGIQAIHFVSRVGAGGRPRARETFDILLEFGADIHAQTDAGTMPATYALELGNEEWLEFLVSRGAKVE